MPLVITSRIAVQYGLWLQAIVDFLIIAFSVFVVVRVIRNTERALKSKELAKKAEEEAKKKKVGGGTTLYYFKEMGEHSATDYLTATSKPRLILQGEKDFQATVERDYQAYQQLLAEKNNVTFRLYENLNHAFVPSVYGTIMKAKQEYNVEQHIGEDVITDIADWIMKIRIKNSN